MRNVTDFPPAGTSAVAVTESNISKPMTNNKAPHTVDGDLSLSDINSAEVTGEEEEEVDDRATRSKATSCELNEEQITEKFRNYLLYGNVTEALDWATENSLWGHALFLASKLDRRSHANVMMKFANKLTLNDPLQTLYQLMSLRMPSSVTSVVDKKWGDWRPHLAMIISNTSQRPDLDRRAITALGDSLFHIGDVYGSHFCYLMAQVGFGKYEAPGYAEAAGQQSATASGAKLILLGSSPHRPFKEFAATDSIMMTEIYEYAVTLSDEHFHIPEFQVYKFMLATRMLDYGYQLKALLYLEQLAKHISRDPSKYETSLVANVCNFADQLRYYDPMQEKLGNNPADSRDSDDADNQKWIQNLKETLNVMAGADNRDSGLMVAQQGSNQSYQPQPVVQAGTSIDQQFSEINQQMSDLNLQYEHYGRQQMPTGVPGADEYNNAYDQHHYLQQQQQQQPSQNQYNQGVHQHEDSVGPITTNTSDQQAAYQNQYQEQQQQPTFYNPNSYDDDSQAAMGMMSNTADPMQQHQQQQSPYDYYGQQQQQQDGMIQVNGTICTLKQFYF